MLAGISAGRLAVLGALVFFAGVVDALAGGGGLITLPAYLAAGLNPALVLGTNKLASSIGTTAACLKYQGRQRLALMPLAPAILACLAGSFAGARLAVRLDPSFIRIALLIALPMLTGFLLTRRRFGSADSSARFTTAALRRRCALVALPLGIYDGAFGPGTGTFLALGLARWCGYDLLGATGRAKILNLTTNLAALAAFLLAGRVQLALGLLMGAVSICGNYVGSHWGLKRGAKAIRPLMIFVCAALFAKLFWH